MRHRVFEERLGHTAVDKNVPDRPDGKLAVFSVEASRGKVDVAGGTGQALITVPQEAVDATSVVLNALHDREATSYVMENDRTVHGPGRDEVVHVLAVAPGDIRRRIVVTVELAEPHASFSITDVREAVDCAGGQSVAATLKAYAGDAVRQLDGRRLVRMQLEWPVSDINVKGTLATRIFDVDTAIQRKSEFSLTLVQLPELLWDLR